MASASREQSPLANPWQGRRKAKSEDSELVTQKPRSKRQRKIKIKIKIKIGSDSNFCDYLVGHVEKWEQFLVLYCLADLAPLLRRGVYACAGYRNRIAPDVIKIPECPEPSKLSALKTSLGVLQLCRASIPYIWCLARRLGLA